MKLNTPNKNKILKNINQERLNIAIYNSVCSTNDECKSLTYANDFNIVLAEEQTKGKGRMGKEKKLLVSKLLILVLREILSNCKVNVTYLFQISSI